MVAGVVPPRVVDPTGGESLIEFVKHDWADIEMRSRDVAVFSYWGGRVAVVQNLTVRRYDRVWRPTNWWLMLAMVVGVVAAILLVKC